MSWTPEEARKVFELRGRLSAVHVAKHFKCSPESVRRLWRGETYLAERGLAEPKKQGFEMPQEISVEADEFLKHLMSEGAAK